MCKEAADSSLVPRLCLRGQESAVGTGKCSRPGSERRTKRKARAKMKEERTEEQGGGGGGVRPLLQAQVARPPSAELSWLSRPLLWSLTPKPNRMAPAPEGNADPSLSFRSQEPTSPLFTSPRIQSLKPSQGFSYSFPIIW